jgi:hypothetical protein
MLAGGAVSTPTTTTTRLVVANAGPEGVRLRSEPASGTSHKVLNDGASLIALGEERLEAGRTWRRVRDTDGAEGWVASDFLVAAGNPSPAGTLGVARTPATTTSSAAGQAGQRPATSGEAQPHAGICPMSHPIKGNLASGGERIYHVRGGQFYARTDPEACFATESDAMAAGFRRSQR